MPTAKVSIQIDRPLEEVFEYAIAIDKLHEWVPVILEAWATSGNPPETGATYTVKAQLGGRTMEIPSVVVGFEPNQLYAYRSYGFLTYTDTMTFQETNNGTLVTELLDFSSSGLFERLLDPIKLLISKNSHTRNQKLLKSILESRK